MKYWLRRFSREEMDKLRKMTPREAVEYIWQYFGLFIVLGIGLIWLIIWGITRLIAGSPQYWVYGVFANSLNGAEEQNRLMRDFLIYSGYDTDEKQVLFSNNMYFIYSEDRVQGREYYDSFVALTDTGTLDFITMRPEQLSPLGRSGRLMNWNSEECAALREKYADRLIWYEPVEDSEITEPFPVGIDISDSRLVTDYHIYTESAAFGIGGQSTRLDAAELFLEFIFDEQ